ncbi:MAG: PIG-L family deacetylase [Candidatus Hydrogenedens sp.]|nr:PIG-L family deacetylase [Candidatus Hydrogenedentota bacterium]NLF56852.1 PIG-L family deacetylase [Candidatus Hydrogenedens sp.]
MKLSLETAELFVPDGLPLEEALARTTHMAVAAHQDDIEIMAHDGVAACFQQPDKWFTGVVVTNGAGSPRDGVYARYTDDEMILVRRKEQKKAAVVGEYAAQALLDLPSGAVKDAANTAAVDDLEALLRAARPEVVYTHNLADKHDTHVGVTLKLIAALRRLPTELRPKKLYGCEVWRDLDWMTDGDKVAFDTTSHENLQAALLGVFDSQIAGGKRYDLATMGRRRAHATYHASHGVDATTGTVFAMDLSPLLQDDGPDPLELVLAHIGRFQREVEERFGKLRHKV